MKIKLSFLCFFSKIFEKANLFFDIFILSRLRLTKIYFKNSFHIFFLDYVDISKKFFLILE